MSAAERCWLNLLLERRLAHTPCIRRQGRPSERKNAFSTNYITTHPGGWSKGQGDVVVTSASYLNAILTFNFIPLIRLDCFVLGTKFSFTLRTLNGRQSACKVITEYRNSLKWLSLKSWNVLTIINQETVSQHQSAPTHHKTSQVLAEGDWECQWGLWWAGMTLYRTTVRVRVRVSRPWPDRGKRVMEKD